jgi:hypothetical protein
VEDADRATPTVVGLPYRKLNQASLGNATMKKYARRETRTSAGRLQANTRARANG